MPKKKWGAPYGGGLVLVVPLVLGEISRLPAGSYPSPEDSPIQGGAIAPLLPCTGGVLPRPLIRWSCPALA